MKEKNKRIHSGAVRVSRISDYLKLNESLTKKISSKTSSDIKVDADDMIVKTYRDMRSFASDFIKAYNQEDCEDLWSARDYLSNYEEDRVFCFSNPTNDRIYFCVELDYSSNMINVFYVYIDKDGKQYEMWHHNDYDNWYEDLDLDMTYNIGVSPTLEVSSNDGQTGRWVFNNGYNTYNEQTLVNLIQFIKTFVAFEFDGNGEVSPSPFRKFKRKYGYSSKDFTEDIEGGFDGEVLNDQEWLYDVADKMRTYFDSLGVGKSFVVLHKKIMEVFKDRIIKGNFFELEK